MDAHKLYVYTESYIKNEISLSLSLSPISIYMCSKARKVRKLGFEANWGWGKILTVKQKNTQTQREVGKKEEKF